VIPELGEWIFPEGEIEHHRREGKSLANAGGEIEDAERHVAARVSRAGIDQQQLPV